MTVKRLEHNTELSASVTEALGTIAVVMIIVGDGNQGRHGFRSVSLFLLCRVGAIRGW